MSFPPRPPHGMMHRMQQHQPMFGIVPPPPMPPMGHHGLRPRIPYMGRPRGPPPNIPRDPSGSPPVTVFVGNISERAQDAMIRTLLASCGPLVSWKRVQGATGKLQAFGFCEYASPEHALRAIRLLHDFNVGEKKLVVKVDAKTKTTLDEYNKSRRKSATGKSPTLEENDKEDFMDDEIRRADKMTRDQINSILKDHEKEMNNFVPPEGYKERKPRVEDPDSRQTGPKQSLDDVEMEDNKRDIIHREIDKFREIMKLREAEKEEEKKKRDKDTDKIVEPPPPSASKRERSKERDRERESRSRDEEGGSDRRKERERSIRRRQSPSRSPSRVRSVSPREERSSRSMSHRHRVERRTRSRTRTKSRSRSRERSTRDRERNRERETPSRKSTKEIWKEEEMEEEAKERKKADRKARDKEASYQERLRRWEDREVRRVKDYEKEVEKEQKRVDDIEREANKIKEFLEDYDDDRDDVKFYQKQKLEQRLAERNRELQKDVEDRQREKEETEELRVQIIKEGYKDPSAELQRRLAERERFNNPAAFVQRHYEEVTLDADVMPIEPTNGQYGISGHHYVKDESVQRFERGPPVVMLDDDDNARQDDIADDDHDDGGHYDAAPSPTYSQNSNSHSGFRRSPKSVTPSEIAMPPSAPVHLKSPTAPSVQLQLSKQSFSMTSNRKKIDVKDVFNQDDEEIAVAKKRKLPAAVPPTSNAAVSSHSDKKAKETVDDKRRHIKSLIDKIPTQKQALFEYKVEWDLVDSLLMEKRIRPWVSKKIAEYIGEPEPTLSDFICTKVLAGSTPKAVLEDVQMVLDDEAEVFVVKLWRLLIYEIENKKLKATMSTTTA